MCNRAGNPVAEQKTPVVDGKLDARMIEADQILYPHRAIEHMPQVGLGQHMVARQPHEPSVAVVIGPAVADMKDMRSEEHTSELQSLMRISYAVFCLKKKKLYTHNKNSITIQLIH